MGSVRQWVTGGTLHPIKGLSFFFSPGFALCKQRGFFWSVIYRRLLLLTSSLRRRLAEKTQREERERASTGYPPTVNSKVNRVERGLRTSTSVTQTWSEVLAHVLKISSLQFGGSAIFSKALLATTTIT